VRLRIAVLRAYGFAVVRTLRLIGMRDESILFDRVFKIVCDPQVDWRDSGDR